MIESQSIGGIPENITYFYRDDNLESTRGTRFQVNPINSRIWVADVVSSKAPKTFGDRQVKGAFIRRRTHLELGPRGHYIMQRGFGYTPELVERQTLLVLGNAQLQQCRLGGHHRRSDLHMGRLIPEKNHSQKEDGEAVRYMVCTTGGDGSWYIMVPPVMS